MIVGKNFSILEDSDWLVENDTHRTDSEIFDQYSLCDLEIPTSENFPCLQVHEKVLANKPKCSYP